MNTTVDQIYSLSAVEQTQPRLSNHIKANYDGIFFLGPDTRPVPRETSSRSETLLVLFSSRPSVQDFAHNTVPTTADIIIEGYTDTHGSFGGNR